MIDVKELRIGSKVMYGDVIQTISVVFKNAVSFDFVQISQDEYKKFNCKDINGIPLTEEILLKCGFEQKKNATRRFILLLEWSLCYLWHT